MDNSTALAFCYPKAAGLLTKAFLKDRAQLLFECESLTALWDMLFKEPVPLVPETLLARQIEEKAFDNFLSDYIFFLNQYDKPPLVLLDYIKRYEIENLKEIIDALCAGKKERPALLDLKSFERLNVKAWPDLAKMTEGTEFSWLKTVPALQDLQSVEFKIDLALLRENWKAIDQKHGDSREGHKKLFLDEFVIKNIIWALRLELYYEMPHDEIIKNLFYVTDSPCKEDPLAAPAIKVLGFDVHKYSDWENWEYSQYLNPRDVDGLWCVDPVWIERSYLRHQAAFANHIFHQYTMEDTALAAWFKLKSYELTCIRTAVESLRLKINPEEAMEAVGING